MRARESFGNPRSDPYTFRQVYPLRLGTLLNTKGVGSRLGSGVETRAGLPGRARRQAQSLYQAAFQRQASLWAAQDRVFPCTRPLHYHPTALADL